MLVIADVLRQSPPIIETYPAVSVSFLTDMDW